MTPFITEILEQINKEPELLLTKYKDNYAIATLLKYAYDKTLKFNLPQGEPPYKKDEAPIGMSPANFYQQVKKLYVFNRPDLSNVRREQLFIQLLEGLHPSEATILVHVKDQSFNLLYPNITSDLVLKANLVTKENLFRGETGSTGKGRILVVDLSDAAGTKDKFGAPPPKVVEPTSEPKKRGPGRPKKNPAP